MHGAAPTMAQGGFDAVTRDRRDGCDLDSSGDAFKPPLDVIAADGCILIEMVLPGVERSDVVVERVGAALVVRGVRRDEHGSCGARRARRASGRARLEGRVIPFRRDAARAG